jgi:hypothetical protein
MKLIHSLSGVVIVFSLGVNSGAAVARVTEQVSNSVSPSQTEPVLIADFFRDLQNAIETIEDVDQTIDLLDQGTQENTADPQEVQESGEQLEQRLVEQAPVQPDNNQPPVQPNNSQAPFQWNSRPAPYQFNNIEELYQRLAKRSNESYEEWFARIDQITLYMRGEIYRPWIRTLSTEDRQVYDALVRQQNSQRAQQFDQEMQQLIEADRQRQLRIRECEARNPNAVCY